MRHRLLSFAVTVVGLTLLGMIAAAVAQDSGASFTVSVRDPQTHEWRRYADTVVPLRPDDACYDWALYLRDATTTATVEETFILPAAPAHWPASPQMELREGGRIAVSRLTLPITGGWPGGWISHGWCVAAGDPEGEYVIEVRKDNQLLHRYCFLVVAESVEPSPPRSPPPECGAPVSEAVTIRMASERMDAEPR